MPIVPSDAGVRLQVVEPTDPMRKRKMRMLRTGPLWAIVPIVAIYIVLAASEPGPSLVFMAVVIVVIAALDAVAYVLVSDRFHSFTEPLVIYAGGLLPYSSVLNRLRGVDGFLRKGEIARIELRSTASDPRYARLVDWAVIVHLRNGKSRMAARRSPVKARAAAAAMRTAWGVPVDDRLVGSR